MDLHRGTRSAPIGGAEPRAGFRATLSEASLPDLLQIECARGERSVVRVRSATRTGYVFFDGGRVVHATAGALVGEAAFFAILGFRGGEFQRCDLPFPAQPTIDEPMTSLLLRAACAEDEAERARTIPTDSGATLLPFPEPPAAREPTDRSQLIATARVAPPVPDEAREVIGVVRLGPDSEVLHQRGEVEGLAPMAAYAVRIAALVADRLGLEPLDALHADLGGAHVFVVLDANETIALTARAGRTVEHLCAKHRV